MAGEFEFSIIASFKDEASRGVKQLAGHLETLNDYARRGRRGLLGGLFGGFGRRGAISGPRGGLGGIISGIGRLTAKAVAMPAKIVGAFARMLPKIGDIAGGAINSVVNVLQGLAVTAANIAGHVVNVFVRAFQRVASVAGRVLGKVAAYGGAAAAGATAYSVWQAAGVEEAWARVETIAGEVPEKIRRKVKELSYDTGRQFKEVIGGYYQVLSAGITDTGKAFEFLRSTLKGAVGGAANFETTVKAVSRTIRAMGKSTGESLSVMDKLLKTVEAGQIEMPELAGVIGRVAGAGSLAGARLDELLAALGHLAQTGPPEVVATQLRAFLQSLVKLPAQARKEIKKLRKQGIDLRPQVMQEEGMLEYLRRLRQVPRESLTNIIPRRRGLQGAAKLMGMLDKIEDTTREIDQASGKTLANYRKRMNTLTKQAQKAWTGLRNLATAFGKPIADWLKNVLKNTRGEFQSWESTAEAAGQTVRDAFKRAYEYVRGLLDGRDLDWSGVTHGLKQLAGDLESAIRKGADAGLSYVQSLWPQVRDTILIWVNKLKPHLRGLMSDTLGDVLGGLDEMVQNQWQALGEQLKREDVKSLQRKLREERQKPQGRRVVPLEQIRQDIWELKRRPAHEFIPQTQAGAIAEGVVTQFNALKALEKAVGPLARAGTYLGAQDSKMTPGTRKRIEQLRKRRWRQQVGVGGRGLFEIAERATRGGRVPTRGEWQRLYGQVKKVVKERGGGKDEQRKMFQKLEELLLEITRDLQRTEEEQKKMRRQIERISTARY